jgi:putative membrane protein
MQFLPLVLSAATIAAGLAQQPAQTAKNTANRVDASTMNPNEARFVQEALAKGRGDVEMGQMALRPSASPAVKAYAQRLVNDHSAANKKLEQISKEYGIAEVTLPSQTGVAYRSSQERTSMNRTGIDPKTNQPAPGPRSRTARLANMTGPDFDHAFAEQMVRDHQEAIADFEAARSTAMNPDVKAFIDATLPTLREHLSEARSLK